MTLTPPTSDSMLYLHGDVLCFDAPPDASLAPQGARLLHDGWVVVRGERIAEVHPAEFVPPADATVHDWRGHLISAGFIDTHLHYPQLSVMASYGAQLLDWLNQYTFPAEAAFAEPQVCIDAAQFFFTQLAQCGTTSAAVYPTVHKHSVSALFDAAPPEMQLISGKVLMNQGAPANLCDTTAQAERDCIDLISQYHGCGRFKYAVTPRFALTSSPDQLAMAGDLLRQDSSLYCQTHLAENHAEIAAVAAMFPHSRSYLDVYAQFGLLTDKTIFGHGIHLDEADRTMLAQHRASIAFCPTSNLFLGSGLLDWQALRGSSVGISLASDVGGGLSMSMLKTLAAAYQILALRGTKLTAWQGFYTATMGAADTLQSSDTGRISAGAFADIVVLKYAATELAARRIDAIDSASGEFSDHEKLFALMMLGDERNTAATYIAGRRVY